MATNEIDDPEFWRFRAEEVRSIADDMKVVEAKAIMARIRWRWTALAPSGVMCSNVIGSPQYSQEGARIFSFIFSNMAPHPWASQPT